VSFINNRRKADDPSAFKATFGRFATGVAVVTCAPEGEPPMGVTINALASVSLDPALALFCLDDRATALSSFLRAGHFALNILAEDQADLSNRFASEHAVRDDDPTEIWDSGAPVLRSALSVADCVLLDTHGGGDHVILLGRVVQVGYREDAAPLLYYGGGYGKFTP
jgi:flavin reductase (DIM6/NTAB) family NADH-FMN oxidoreductase RutF